MKKMKKLGRAPFGFFLLLFGQFSAVHKSEDRARRWVRRRRAKEEERENEGQKGEEGRREQGGRWWTRNEEGREAEVTDRQAKLARPSRSLADVK